MNLSSIFLLEFIKTEVDKAWNEMPLWLVSIKSVVIIIGILGNVWLLYKGLSNKKVRNSAFHLLLMNHALANFLLATFCYTSFVFKLRTGLPTNELQIQLCLYFTLFMLILVEVSLFTNGALAINRVLSCYPLSPLSIALRTKRATCLIIGIIWFISALIYISAWAKEHESWVRLFACFTIDDILAEIISGEDPFDKTPAKYIIPWTLASTQIFILLVNAIAYGIIAIFLLKQHRLGKKGLSEQRQKEKRRALLVIVLLFCILLICWTPLSCALLVDSGLIMTRHVFVFMPPLEAALDPVLCVLTMPAFRPGWVSNKGRRTLTTVSQMDSQISDMSHLPHNGRRGTITAWEG